MSEIIEAFYGRSFSELSEDINKWKKANEGYTVSHMSTRNIVESDGCGGSVSRGTEALVVFVKKQVADSKPLKLKLNRTNPDIWETTISEGESRRCNEEVQDAERFNFR